MTKGGTPFQCITKQQATILVRYQKNRIFWRFDAERHLAAKIIRPDLQRVGQFTAFFSERISRIMRTDEKEEEGRRRT